MSKQTETIDRVIRESTLAEALAERGRQVVNLGQQVAELSQENEKLKKEIEKLKGENSEE